MISYYRLFFFCQRSFLVSYLKDLSRHTCRNVYPRTLPFLLVIFLTPKWFIIFSPLAHFIFLCQFPPFSFHLQAILLNHLLHDLTVPSERSPMHYQSFFLAFFAPPFLPSSPFPCKIINIWVVASFVSIASFPSELFFSFSQLTDSYSAVYCHWMPPPLLNSC